MRLVGVKVCRGESALPGLGSEESFILGACCPVEDRADAEYDN